ncbi:DUF998 domain-containing protein [Candidatus Bathyarchaeota archaeon]|nr:DUF998 domain-containing protein [Candidatus Bathyarchaeota archaeon]
MKSTKLRSSAIFGFITPIFGFIVIFLAISYAPWFSWTGNALSDLGTSGTESMIFNYGLMATGLLILGFSRGLFELSEGNRLGRIGTYVHVLGALFLFAIGVLNINIRPWHFFVSVGFFVTFPSAVIIYSVFLYKKGMQSFAYIGWVMGVIALLIWTMRWSSVAIPEAASAGLISIWQINLAYWMWKKEG